MYTVYVMSPQLSVDDAQKTKENYRTTIKKLREENTQLKAQLSEAAKDKRPSVAPKPEKPCPVSKEQQAMNEMLSLREERSQLKDQLQSAQREIDSLATQIKGHSLDQQATNAIKRKVLLLPIFSTTFCHFVSPSFLYKKYCV